MRLEEKRAALLEDLRRSHRDERAPAKLRQQVLERLDEAGERHHALHRGGPRRLSRAAARGVSSLLARAGSPSESRLAARRPAWLTLPSLALIVLSFAALPFVLRSSDLPGFALGPEPHAELRPAQAPSRARGARDPQRPCPLRAMPEGATIMPRVTDEIDQRHFGVMVHAFDMQMPSCGTITRRYLTLMPGVRKPRATVPVLVVLHDTGQSAETMRVNETHWHLDELVKREAFILVYANAAPGASTRVDVANSGGWATDGRTHPEIEDDVYLERIVSDLVARELIDGTNDVFLLGYGGGATMALDVAARHPSAYAGVAAFKPRGLQDIAPPVRRGAQKLARVLFVLSEPSRLARESGLQVLVPALARQWGQGLGISRAPLQRRWQLGTSSASIASVRQLDVATPASGSAAVRVLVLDPALDPFPVAPVGPRGRRDEAPPLFDGARQAWAFLSGVEGADPSVPSLNPSDVLASEPLFVDGDSSSVQDTLPEDTLTDHTLAEDADRYDVPSVVLEEDVVKATRPGSR
jgi:predicted esterase